MCFHADDDFQAWSGGGIYTGTPACTAAERVNHAVLVVGYDTGNTAGMPHWLVKVRLLLRLSRAS